MKQFLHKKSMSINFGVYCSFTSSIEIIYPDSQKYKEWTWVTWGTFTPGRHHLSAWVKMGLYHKLPRSKSTLFWRSVHTGSLKHVALKKSILNSLNEANKSSPTTQVPVPTVLRLSKTTNWLFLKLYQIVPQQRWMLRGAEYTPSTQFCCCCCPTFKWRPLNVMQGKATPLPKIQKLKSRKHSQVQSE